MPLKGVTSAAVFFQKNEKKSPPGLTPGKMGVLFARRVFFQLNLEHIEMKTIAILLACTAFTAAGNTLPPTPEENQVVPVRR